jgi:type II secretory pathway pseudopilin PulG
VSVNKLETKSSDRTRRNGERGYSIIEILIVMVMLFTITAMALIALQPTLQGFKANGSMTLVASELKMARETAITERRNIQVAFAANNTITLTRVLTLGMVANPNEQFGVFRTVQIAAPTQFMLTPGMADTPDAFGKNGAIEFEGIVGGPPTMMFQSDGTFVDTAGNLVNGTVFLGIPGMPSAARAVTVLGATGRIRMYRGNGQGGWLQ